MYNFKQKYEQGKQFLSTVHYGHSYTKYKLIIWIIIKNMNRNPFYKYAGKIIYYINNNNHTMYIRRYNHNMFVCTVGENNNGAP